MKIIAFVQHVAAICEKKKKLKLTNKSNWANQLSELTPAKNDRSMFKNPIALIAIRKLLICVSNSHFAMCNLRLSEAQNVIFSMNLTYSVIYNEFMANIYIICYVYVICK